MQPKHSITVTGTEGTVEAYRGGFAHKNSEILVRCRAVGSDGKPGEPTEEAFGFTGFDRELDDFYDMVCRVKAGDQVKAQGAGLADVEEGLLDMAMIEALIQSGETGEAVDIA